MGIRLLVCGGRKFWDKREVFRALSTLNQETLIDTIIHGAQKGADTLAGQWAYENYVPEYRFYANWYPNGKLFLGAGPELMVKMGNPHMVLAFPGGKGTASMLKISNRYNIPIKRVGDGSSAKSKK